MTKSLPDWALVSGEIVSGQTRGEGAANTSGDGGVAATPAFTTLPVFATRLPVFALGRATPLRAAWQASLPRQKEIYLKSYGAPP